MLMSVDIRWCWCCFPSATSLANVLCLIRFHHLQLCLRAEVKRGFGLTRTREIRPATVFSGVSLKRSRTNRMEREREREMLVCLSEDRQWFKHGICKQNGRCNTPPSRLTYVPLSGLDVRLFQHCVVGLKVGIKRRSRWKLCSWQFPTLSCNRDVLTVVRLEM